MAILYKGYAQQKGFGANLVKVPDPSDKIRRQGLETLKGMQQEVDWNNKQATRVINALEKNAQIEAKNRADNFELRQFYSQSIHDQKQRNFAVLHQSARTRQRAQEQKIKSLLQLTKTGAALYQKYDAKRKEDADIWQQQLYNEHGLGWEKMNALKSATDEIWQDSAQRELLLQKLGLDGVPDDVIDRVRNVSGYRAIAMGKSHARRWSYDTGLYYAENFNTKVDIAGMQVDLHSARGDQVHTVLQLLDAKRRRDAGANAPSSKMLGLSGGYEVMERARGNIIANKTKEASDDAVKRQWEDEMTFLHDALAPGPDGIVRAGAGIENLIKYYAGGDNSTRQSMRSARNRVVGTIIHGLQTNQISWNQVKALENHPMKIGGATKTFSQFFEREWATIEKAGVTNATQAMAVAQLGSKQTKIKDQQFLSDLHGLASENPPPETWAKMLAIANSPENNYKESARFISDVMARGQNAANDSQALATVQGRITRGERVTAEEIRLLKPSSQAEASLIALANKNNEFLPTEGEYGSKKQIEATVDSMLKNRIPATVLDDKSDVRLSAKIGAMTMATNYYKGLTQSGMSHEDALENTRKYISSKILEKGGDFEPVYNEITQSREFQGYRATGEWVKIDVDDNGGLVEFANNHNLMYSTPLINRDELEKKSIALNSGQSYGMIPRASFLESTIGHTPNSPKALAIEQAQIEYHNSRVKETGKGTMIQPYPDWYIKSVTDTYNRFSPRAQRLLNNWGYCDINRAACESQMSPIYNKPVVEQAQSILSEDEDYNRTDKGNSYKKFGFDISTRSINDIVTLQQGEKFLLAGRYGFDHESLTEAVELAGLSMNDKFTAVIQDKLFEAYFKTNGMRMLDGIQDPQERLLLESTYRLMTEPKLGPLGFNEPALLQPLAFKAKFEGGLYG